MDKGIFVAIGFATIAMSQVVLYLFGIDAVVETPLNFGLYAALLFAGVSALLGGFGIDVGFVSWRIFAGATYFFFSAMFVASFFVVDVTTYSSVPKPIYGVIVLVSTVILLAMGIDVALNRQQIVKF